MTQLVTFWEQNLLVLRVQSSVYPNGHVAIKNWMYMSKEPVHMSLFEASIRVALLTVTRFNIIWRNATCLNGQCVTERAHIWPYKVTWVLVRECSRPEIPLALHEAYFFSFFFTSFPEFSEKWVQPLLLRFSLIMLRFFTALNSAQHRIQILSSFCSYGPCIQLFLH